VARRIPFECVVDPIELIAITILDKFDNPVNTLPMTCQSPKSSGAATCKLPQCMVDRTPKYENQVIGRKSKIIRRDKRKKARYL